MSDVRDSMRDYINVIANPAEAGDSIPASTESQSIDTVSPSSMCDPSEREVHGISHDPEQNAPLTAMTTSGSTLVGRIGELARALQAVFDSEDTPDSYYPDDMHDSEDSHEPEEHSDEDSEEETDYERSQEENDSRELLNDEDEELDEAAPAETAGMAPRVDQAGHRSYADGQGSSFAARKGMTG